MNIKSIGWLTIAVLQLGIAGNTLAVTVYTDRAAFEAALLSSDVETFESYAPFGDPDPQFNIPDGLTDWTGTYFSLHAEPKAIKLLDHSYPQPPVSYVDVINTTSGGTKFLYLDTDNEGKSDGSTIGSATTITLNSPVDAFGFNYTGVFQPGTTFMVQIGLDTFPLNLNSPRDNPLFWGVLGLGTSFDEITLTTSLDSGYGVDDVIFGSAVPLPPAFWLFGSGLLALAGGARKSKTRS